MDWKFFNCVLLSLFSILFHSFWFRSWQHPECIRCLSDLEEDKSKLSSQYCLGRRQLCPSRMTRRACEMANCLVIMTLNPVMIGIIVS